MPRGDEPRDIHHRHGLLMRDVQELRDRVEALERLHDDDARRARSIRPKVESIGVSVFVSGAVAGLVQGLAAMLR